MGNIDLKKLALLGVCSGMMLAAASSDSLYAGSHENPEGEDVKSEKNGCSGKNACGGPGGCNSSDESHGEDKSHEEEK